MSCGYSATSRSRGIKRRSRQRLAYGTSILFHALGRDGRLLELVRALWTLDRGSSVDLPERRRVCAFAFCSAFGTQLDRGVPTSRRRGGGETSARPRGSDSSNQIKSDRGGGSMRRARGLPLGFGSSLAQTRGIVVINCCAGGVPWLAVVDGRLAQPVRSWRGTDSAE
jgi:hypothetical protein